MSIQELKDLLYARLLSQSSLSSADADLAMLLREQHSAAPPDIRSVVQGMINPIIQELQELKERFTVLETSCRPQAQGMSTRHDDPDSEDHHEGEKRAQGTSSQAIVAIAATEKGQTTEAEQSTHQRQEQHMADEDTEPMTVEKPEVTATVETTELVEDYNVDREEDYSDSIFNILGEGQTNQGFGHQDLQNINVDQNQDPDLRLSDEEVSSAQTSAATPSSHAASSSRPAATSSTADKENRKVFRKPFLEEDAQTIFVDNLVELDPRLVLSVHVIKKKFRVEYFHMLKSQQQSLRAVQTNLKITSVNQIYCKKLYKFDFPVFHVQREDGKEWIFSEADFSLLTLEDVEFLYDHLSTLQVRPSDYIVALDAIKRYMRGAIKLESVQDFQIGIESSQPKINLTAPNQQLEHIDSYPIGLIIEEPEFGIIFKNGKSQKMFVRFNEVAKYSDGTLRLIIGCLEKKLRVEKILKPKQSDQDLIERALAILYERMHRRYSIKRYEIYYGARKKKFFKGPPTTRKI